MKILTSYFYQIRNFKPYQIPLSTAISDPAWYHPKNGDYYVDKNGVINGLRIGMLQPQRSLGFLCGGKTCTQQPDSCRFLRAYYDQLCLLYILIKSLKSCRIINTDMSKSMENGQEIVFLDIAIAVENIQNLFV